MNENKKTYIVFRENNSYECESWKRVFPYEGNEEAFNILKDINNINDEYECYLQDYTDDRINSIVDDDRCGYMRYNDYLDILFNVETIEKYISLLKNADNHFYKMEWLEQPEIWR